MYVLAFWARAVCARFMDPVGALGTPWRECASCRPATARERLASGDATSPLECDVCRRVALLKGLWRTLDRGGQLFEHTIDIIESLIRLCGNYRFQRSTASSTPWRECVSCHPATQLASAASPLECDLCRRVARLKKLLIALDRGGGIFNYAIVSIESLIRLCDCAPEEQLASAPTPASSSHDSELPAQAPAAPPPPPFSRGKNKIIGPSGPASPSA